MKYEGHYEKDLKNGHGILVWKNGMKYDGQFKNSTKDGWGILTYPPDNEFDRYEGTFVENNATGRGTIYMSNGEIF